MKILSIVLLACVCFSCKSLENKKTNISQNKQPNILWIVCEDISPTLSFYGDKTAKTPNLDALAKESMVYDNAYSVVGVCAPSRSSIITGMYPTSLGTMHMRTGKDIQSWGTRKYQKETGIVDVAGEPIIEYAAVIPDYVKAFPEYLRKAGYFTSNQMKTDYQFAVPVTVWDQNDKDAHWRNRGKNQPFFSVFNYDETHESKIWKNSNLPLTVAVDSVLLPLYFQDTKTARTDVARNYSNIELLDKQVGKLISQLKEDGLYDNTIVFFYSDHGGPLPRQKRDIHESGLHVPFMVKDLKGTKGRTDRLISFVDLAPTILSLAGVDIPETIQGKAFMGEKDSEARNYVFGTSDRFDEITDRSRAVYDKQYVYVINDFPEKLWYKDILYRMQVPMMKEMIEFRDQNKLNKIQTTWFKPKQADELFEVKKDPNRLHNLVEKPEFAKVRKRLRAALLDFRDTYRDYGMLPEAKLIEQMWPNFEQPTTASVEVKNNKGIISLSSKTKGASIAYIISDKVNEKLDFNSHWTVYSKPFLVEKGKIIYSIAQRIGYKESIIGQTFCETN